ncbi:MAG: type II/IV secretion system ATPase subunit [Archaeoglobaceae archaeon]|nr:type II/IV secretion system ATPase subunit [Archaeoglobaceae archaeon]
MHHYEVLKKYVKKFYELSFKEKLEVVTDYWIAEPFVKAVIAHEPENLRNLYFVIEPGLSLEESKLLSLIASDLLKTLSLKDSSLKIEEKAEILISSLKNVLKEFAVELSDELYSKYLYYLFRDFFGYGAIDPLINDKYIEDVSCNGYDVPIFVYHSKFGNLQTNIRLSKEILDRTVLRLAQICGKHINLANPIIDATLPDGSRLQATYSTTVTPRGSNFTIRKFKVDPLTPIDLILNKTMSSILAAYLWLCVESKLSAIVVGETASGKTTTLNAILMFLPPNAKVVSIEDTREITLYHENWVASVTRTGVGEAEIDMYDLLKTSLRQRPEYIVVGEIRGIEAQTLFQAMSTGHACYSTLHAGDINQVVYRLESEPLRVPRGMLQFLDVVIVQTMWVKGQSRFRRVKEVNEILGIDPVNKNLLVNQFMKWDPRKDEHIEVSLSKKIEKIANYYGASTEEVHAELEIRKKFLEFLAKKGLRDYKSFTALVHKYYVDPEAALKSVM